MLTAGLGLMAAILLFCVAGPLFVDTDADETDETGTLIPGHVRDFDRNIFFTSQRLVVNLPQLLAAAVEWVSVFCCLTAGKAGLIPEGSYVCYHGYSAQAPPSLIRQVS